MAMIDIGHFKAVNDTSSHQARDAVLAAVAAGIRDSLRDYDIAGRFGGERGAVLFPGTGLEQGRLIADQLRQGNAAEPTLIGGSVPVHLTVSIGVAALGPVPADLDELISAADGALYRAKRDGRNPDPLTTSASPSFRRA